MVGVMFGGAAASALHGTPEPLPGASLGWPVLLHFERVAALLGTAGCVLLVGVRATKGRFPSKFGHVEYATRDIDSGTETAAEAQERRLVLIEAMLGIRSPGEHREPDNGREEMA